MLKFLTVFLLLSTSALFAAPPNYVILFIGDGMGPDHIRLARDAAGGRLNMDSMPVRGELKTGNAAGTTTDSAAAATALACGVKTFNGALGMDASKKKVNSSAWIAKNSGRRIGILTSVTFNHATPGGFYAHVPKRTEYGKIAEQAYDARFDLIMGYGVSGLKEKEVAKDAADTGLNVIHDNPEDFFKMNSLEMPTLVFHGMGYEIDRKDQKIKPLSEYTAKVIAQLSLNELDRFFIMVEGGKIDVAAHGNDAPAMVAELLEFDRAIGKALDFYQKHPENTLILVTADHETGGLAYSGSPDAGTLRNVKGSIPRAFGFENTDTPAVVEQRLAEHGITQLTPAEKEALRKALAAPEAKRSLELHREARKIQDTRCGISWATKGHTSANVQVFAIGKEAKRFSGVRENSEFGALLKQLLREE